MHIQPQLIGLIIVAAALGCDPSPIADPGSLPATPSAPEPNAPEPSAPAPSAPAPSAPEPDAPEPAACAPEDAAPQAECADVCDGGSDFSRQQLVTAWIPSAIAAADLNQDGRSDVIAAHSALSAVSVRLADVDGSLVPRQIYPIAGMPTALAVADVNGDALDDLVTVSAGGVHVLLGTGAGDLLPPILSEARTGNPSESTLAVADLDGDGVLDVLLGHTYNRAEALSVLIGQGDGRFEPGERSLIAGSVVGVEAADLDQDGHVDLLFLDEYAGALGVMAGQGEGRFAEPVHYPSTGARVASADVNGDGLIDVIVTGGGPAQIWITQPDGSLQADQARAPDVLVAVDIDRDGDLDFITAEAGGVGVRRKREAGFEPTARYAMGPVIAAVVADVNGDAHRDLLVAVSNSGEVGVMLGRADGGFAVTRPTPEGVGPWATASADLDGDGAPDLVSVSLHSGILSVALGNGDGSFQALAHHPVGAGPRSVAIADLDGDCLLDLLVASGDGLSVLRGLGAGRFASSIAIPGGPGIQTVAAADLNADGYMDVVATAWTDGRTRRGHAHVWLGVGGGALRHHAEHPAGNSPVSLTVADLNRDGAQDLVIGDFDRYRSGVSVLLGDGVGGFDPARRVVHRGEPTSVAVADVDGDDALDLITANSFSNSISVLRGHGDGTFAEATRYPAGNQPSSIAVADVDADCALDVIVVNSGTNDLRVLRGAGDGTFGGARAHGLGAFPRGLTVADFDRDGRPDLAAANSGATTISLLLNQGCQP